MIGFHHRLHRFKQFDYLCERLDICRGRVCLPEYIYVDAYGRADPAPTMVGL